MGDTLTQNRFAMPEPFLGSHPFEAKEEADGSLLLAEMAQCSDDDEHKNI